MNHSIEKLRQLWIGLGLVTTAMPIHAQTARSTLSQLAGQADIVTRARVLGSDVDDGTRRIVFKVKETLAGHLTGTFTVSEPSGRACSDALHGVLVGSSYLVFLNKTGDGPRLAVASSRAIAVADAATLTHVRNLVATGSTPARLALLTAALTSRNARVRGDAAADLPRLRTLDQASTTDRQRIVDALDTSLGTDDRTAMSLLRAASRLRLRAAVGVTLRHYLGDESGRLREVLLQTLPALDSRETVARLEFDMPNDRGRQQRAIALLGRCSGQRAAACLQRLTKSSSPDVAQLATAALARQAVPTGARHREFRSVLQSIRR